MPSIHMTDQVIKRLRSETGRTEYWDQVEKGLCLRVSADGSRVWSVRYRLVGGQRRRYKLGAYPETSLAVARDQARIAKAKASKGHDPQGARAAGRENGLSAPRVSDLAKRFMEEHASKKASSTARNYELAWRLHVLPALGRRRVEEVSWSDVDGLHRKMGDTPYMANRVLALISKAWNLAQRWGWYPRELPNPGVGHDRFAEKRTGKALSGEELRRLGAALEEETDVRALAVRVALLSGARPSEIRELKWEHVSPDCRVLDLPETKTGRRSVYLGQPAAEILLSFDLERNGPVFPNPATGRPYADLKPVERRLKKVAELSCRPYDWYRHTFVSIALELGVPMDRVKRLAGHALPDITGGVYGHISRKTLLEDADRVAEALQTALNGGAVGSSGEKQGSIILGKPA